MPVIISIENKRWCGYRSPSAGGVGIYLIGPGNFDPCERLPFPLETCACCGGGIKHSRGYTWIDPSRLFDPWVAPRPCAQLFGNQPEEDEHDHNRCFMCNPLENAGDKAGLIWVGEKFYRTPFDFIVEAQEMGISRKIGAMPLGFEVGKTVIYLAHRKTSIRFNEESRQNEWVQGVFCTFRPIRVDLVIDDPDDVPARAIDLVKRLGEENCRIIKVIAVEEGEDDEADGR